MGRKGKQVRRHRAICFPRKMRAAQKERPGASCARYARPLPFPRAKSRAMLTACGAATAERVAEPGQRAHEAGALSSIGLCPRSWFVLLEIARHPVPERLPASLHQRRTRNDEIDTVEADEPP